MKSPTLAWIAIGTAVLTQSSFAPAFAQSPKSLQARKAQSDIKGAQALVELQTRPSAEQRLPSEAEITAFGPFASVWSALPKSTWLEPTTNHNVPARVAVHEIGIGKNETIIVCIHGLFSEGEIWRLVAGAFKGNADLWLVDLPGTGLSDSPDPRRSGSGAYSPAALADRVLQALESRLAAHSEVSRIVLAGHSYGGMLVLRMFADEEVRQRHAGLLARVEGLVLFAPCDAAVTQATETWTTFLGIDPVKAQVGGALQILQGRVVNSVRESFIQPELASREVAISGVKLLRTGKNRRAMQQIMIEAIPWREFGKHVDWVAVRRIEAGYRNVTVPCLLVWGKCDETLPEAMGHKLNDQLPNARLVLVPETMHLLPIERPALCAELMQNFRHQLASGNLAAARTVQTVEPTPVLAGN